MVARRSFFVLTQAMTVLIACARNQATTAAIRASKINYHTLSLNACSRDNPPLADRGKP